MQGFDGRVGFNSGLGLLGVSLNHPPFIMENNKVLIGIPNGGGLIHHLMVESLMNLERPLDIDIHIVPRSRNDTARNEITVRAMEQAYSYVLYLDDDNPVPPDTITKLLEDDKDIVSVPIAARKSLTEDHSVCAYYATDYDGVKVYTRIQRYRDEGYLHKVDAVGLGCTLVKRKVLEALWKKYREWIFEDGKIIFDKPRLIMGKICKWRRLTTDLEFSERCTKAGFDIWLDGRIRPSHIGEPYLWKTQDLPNIDIGNS